MSSRLRPRTCAILVAAGSTLALSAVASAEFSVPITTASDQRVGGIDAQDGQPTNKSKRRYSVDDLLRSETIGSAMGDPNGRWLVWEQAPRYDRLKDFGLDMNSFGNTGSQLLALDVRTPEAAPKLLFSDDGADSHWLDSFSPDGRYLVYYRSANGAFSMGCYDFATGRTVEFEGAPPIHPFFGHRSVWISGHEFVFTSSPPGEQPYSAIRRQTGQRLWRDWNKAWRGELSVSEVRSGSRASEVEPLGGGLIKANAATGKAVRLAEGLFNSLTVSHDGRYLAGLRQFRKVQPPPGVGDRDWVSTRSQLFLIDLVEGGEPIDVAGGKDVFARSLEWSVDRNRLAFFAWDLGAGAQSGSFHEFDPAISKLVPLPHNGLDLVSERERGLFQQPERAVWIDDRLAVLARKSEAPNALPKFSYRGQIGAASGTAPRADWFLIDGLGRFENLTGLMPDEPGRVPIGADGRSITVLAGGKLWQLAPGNKSRMLPVSTGGPLDYTAKQRFGVDRAPFSRHIALRVSGKNGPSALMIDLATGQSTLTKFPSASADMMGMTPITGVGLFRTIGPRGMSLVIRRGRAPVREVRKLNAHLRNVEQTAFSTVRYQVETPSGRRQVEACLILPAGYKKGGQYPVIVDVYPRSDENVCKDPDAAAYSGFGRSGVYDLHLLAARGYIVLKPNTSGFLTNRPPNPLGGMAAAVDASLDALIAQGYADPDRIGLLGISQGGYSSLWLATQMKRFKAVVSINGWSNMYAHRFDGTFMRRYFADEFPFKGEIVRYESEGESSDFGVGVSVYDHPEIYVRNSPLTHARDISAPVMLVHSDFDFFNMNQYDMMFTALYEMKKEARYLRYAGEGHSPSSPANIRHMWTSIFDWFDTYLGAPSREGRATGG